MPLRSINSDLFSGLENFLIDFLKKGGFVSGDFRMVFGYGSSDQLTVKPEMMAETKKKDQQVIHHIPGLAKFIEDYFKINGPPQKDLDYKVQLKLKTSSQPSKSPTAIHSVEEVFESGKANAVIVKMKNESYKQFAGSDDPKIYRRKKYGAQIAEAFYDYLLSSRGFFSTHQGYCGTGFILEEDLSTLTYCTFYEGAPHEKIKQFKTRKSFVDWFSVQSDESLSRREHKDSFYWDNQTITFAAIDPFLKLRKS